MKHTKQALITLEATLVLPVFIFVVYLFLYFYQIMIVQEILHINATKVAKEISSYGIVTNLIMEGTASEKEEELQELINTPTDSQGLLSGAIGKIDIDAIAGKEVDSLYLDSRMAAELEDHAMIQHCIDGGYEGISFYGSSLFDEDECVTIKMSYQIKFPIFQNVLPKLNALQVVRIRSFNGYSVPLDVQSLGKEDNEEENKEEIVYITKNGSVYHTNKSCVYLNIEISPCLSSEIMNMRNKSGAKYYACERCFDQGDSIPGTVYITSYGNRYHKNTSCTEIDRTILSVPLSEVSGRRLCRRCQQYQ